MRHLLQRMLFLRILILMATVQMTSTQANKCGRIVCYYSNWARYRPGSGKFTPDNIDPSLCTHLIFTFTTFSGNHLAPFNWNYDKTIATVGMFEKVVNIKKRNPSLKVLLAVGGWNLGSAQFTKMVQTSNSRQQFISQSMQFLRESDFDGLDLDWQYSANHGSSPEDKKSFATLVKEMKLAFVREAVQTGKSRLLITAVVATIKNSIDTAFEVQLLSTELDFISIMTYDLHGYWDKVTGHHSPLYAISNENGDQRKLNIDSVAKYWVQKGAKKSQLNIGLAMYGNSFTLDNPANYQLGAPASAPGQAGQYTNEPGFLAYYEVCDMLNAGGKVEFNEDHSVPFAYLGNQWVGFDDRDSLLPKVQYAIENKFGGVMIWALDLDDFDGSHCGRGQYPLIKAIAKECDHTVKLLPIPVTQNPKKVTIEQPPENTSDDAFCLKRENGFYANPSDCVNFIICFNKHTHKMKCPHGATWNDGIKTCDDHDHTPCDNSALEKPEKK